jgi:ribonuclease HII
MPQTVADIRARLKAADAEEFEVLERSLRGDVRKGVQNALAQTRKRLQAEAAERERLSGLYSFQEELAQGGLAVGLDEVGRGPLAGPLTVGAVVLNPAAAPIEGLNDSKQIAEEHRPEVAARAKQAALAYATVNIQPDEIDREGMTACLRKAFSQAIAAIEAQGVVPDVVLLDGNPLRIDPREINVIKGDARCAAIAAASVIAKVERDALMVEYDKRYPGYDFASAKGYGSAHHIAAIQEKGLTPIHRASFCGNFLQETLF